MYGRVEDSDRDKRSFSVRKDGPKFRDYTRLYLAIGKSAPSHLKIEKMMQKQRTHRNIMEVDREFVQSVI